MAHSTGDPDWRNKELKFDSFALIILRRVAIVALLLFIGYLYFASAQISFSVNVYTDIVSIFGSAFIVEAFAANRERKRETKHRQDELIRDLRSTDNDRILITIEALRDEGWLTKVLRGRDLRGGNFTNADLRNVNLEDAKLDGANFTNANLAGTCFHRASLKLANFTSACLWQSGTDEEKIADFREADLSNATLRTNVSFVNFQGAKLQRVDLRNLDMVNCNFAGSDFLGAHLQGASLNASILRYSRFMFAEIQGTNFSQCDLEGAALDWRVSIIYSSAQLDDKTVLPDETYYKPEIGLDQLARFTDRSYTGAEGFWQSEHPEYRKYPATYEPREKSQK